MIDPKAETARYIDGLGADALAKAADYTNGNHWLLLWGIVVSGLVTSLVLRTGLLDRVAGKLAARGWALRTFVVCVAAMFALAIIELPWSIYTDYWRQKSYGLTSQPVADFLGQAGISLILSAVMTGLFFLGVYALMRRTGKRWWLWSGGFAAVVTAIMLLLSPILIEPIFNEYKPVPAGPVRDALIKMADEAAIPHDRIFTYDGSRQSNNFTANVSGILGSARIAISDVALKDASLDEVKAVTGHEIGHYVLGHVWYLVALIAGVALFAFFLADRLFPRFARWFGCDATIDDARSLPVFLFIMAVIALFLQPLVNGMVRMNERAADAYSLRTVNLPDALASALVKTAEYRYPRPTPLQEMLFYTHPSVERRVLTAMEWKAAHPPQ